MSVMVLGIALLNILSGSVRQRLIQELTEVRYGSGYSGKNINPLMVRGPGLP